jgi:hypothetical protein
MNRLFPNCSYYHVIFTVPSQFRILLFEKRTLLNAVFAGSVETLISFCKEQGFIPAVTAVMHTFGSDLKRHIHIHCIISAGGLKLSGKQERYVTYIKRKKRNSRAKKKKITVLTNKPKWVSHSFFPYKMLHKRFQSCLIKHLKKHIQKNINSDNPDNDLRVFSHPGVMESFFDDLKKQYKKGFFVHISKERQDLKPTMGYIGRYARRPPLSEVRIKNYTGDYVTFEYKDYNCQGSKVLHTLKTFEFIKKLIRHIPPHYFNVIRHYGLIASRVKSKYKKITDKLLGSAKDVKKNKNWRERQTEYRGENPLLCKICKRVMKFVSHHIPVPLFFVKRQFQSALPD